MNQHPFKQIIPLVLFCTVFSCSDHIFNNPLDPKNEGEVDEYLLMFQSPAEEPADLAWDGLFLWHSDAKNGELFQINPYDGSLQVIIQLPYTRLDGLTYRDDNLWVTDVHKRRIIEVDSLTGHEIYHFSAPGSNPKGLAYNPEADVLYNVDANTLKIYTLNPDNGAKIAEIASPSSSPRGITYVNEHLYLASFSENVIYVIDPETGEKLTQFEGPDLAPIGLTWDGESLWIVDWDTMIYRLTPSSP